MPDHHRLVLPDERATAACAAALARSWPEGFAHVALEGALGAGKTCLVRHLLRSLGEDGHVRSPTYTLMEHYQPGGRPVWHLDLYRLGDPEELEFLGLRDLLAQPGLLLVEWPSRGAGHLPPVDLRLRLQISGPDARELDLLASSDTGRAWLERSLQYLVVDS